ncbi:HlyU family transcriptional regulator [Vreelandella arcis]|uniref:Transcriptional activator HlyU n=1 Tax=Vreelandella arcis TaxID=416873 RepID=A0A1G9YFB9_9GAMM|nr:HlyU family transcriptional regulator [Halomonas arcis]SDN07829.1 hypothetical protein SAMN04487951_102143 [Halomonas arcis]
MLKKILSALLGGDRESATSKTQASEPVEYRGYIITSQPDNQSGQYRVSGLIRRPQAEGDDLEHRFERSDMLPSRDACDAMMITKAQRYIDEVGDEMFKPDPRRASDT